MPVMQFIPYSGSNEILGSRSYSETEADGSAVTQWILSLLAIIGCFGSLETHCSGGFKAAEG
jgi:hypothetical protein